MNNRTHKIFLPYVRRIDLFRIRHAVIHVGDRFGQIVERLPYVVVLLHPLEFRSDSQSSVLVVVVVDLLQILVVHAPQPRLHGGEVRYLVALVSGGVPRLNGPKRRMNINLLSKVFRFSHSN